MFISSWSSCAYTCIIFSLLNDFFFGWVMALEKNAFFCDIFQKHKVQLYHLGIHTFSLYRIHSSIYIVKIKLHFFVIYSCVCSSVYLFVHPSFTKLVLTTYQRQLMQFHPNFTRMTSIMTCAYNKHFTVHWFLSELRSCFSLRNLTG